MEKRFRQWKELSVKKVDLSKKGSVDEPIRHVVSLLNSREEFFTTSSCSGRVILIDGASESSEVQKQNCVWLFVSHQKCEPDELISAVAKSSGEAVLKFEPFVLHLQCRKLEDAQLVHSVAINSGFRNSGLSISKIGKIILAVRSTHGLEVPLSHEGKLLVEHEYIHFLTQIANQKMEENLRRIERFHSNLLSALPKVTLQELQILDPPISQEQQGPPHGPEAEREGEDEEEEKKEGKKKVSVYTRRRRRARNHETDCCHGDGPISVTKLDDCLDLFT